ncbi:mycothione reductase [Rhodococcoides kyotonense]|uniref:Mycothione reductase n=1 Tax=Rhodococcoides kyotonense TaxID=398843 RepID=A0A239JVL1_9NOCA|nr:mycothione reductase [Rhodococcus kyotonensis]SNT09825.1 mycothione reductase [Rhodococcus kyotonensis]
MHFDIVVIGAGSGNMIADSRFADKSVAIVEEASFGGTCLNVGCIPSKMYAHTADLVDAVSDAPRFGIPADGAVSANWVQVRDRIFDQLDRDARDARRGREDTPNITVLTGTAAFVAPKSLTVTSGDGSTTDISGDRIVVAAGSRPVVPDALSQAGIDCHTSDSIMRVDAAPRRLAVLGGGYIGVEFAHVFRSFGSSVTVIEPSDTLLSGHDHTITTTFTNTVASHYDLRLRNSVTDAHRADDGIVLSLDDGSTVTVDMVLAATGRTPNSDRLACAAAGIDLDDTGHVVIDAQQRTNIDGIFALGDICASVPLKHVANREAKVVADNLLDPDQPSIMDDDLVPSAVFTDPQIASIGKTEQQLKDAGTAYKIGVKKYSDVAFGWALQDETGVCKILVDRDTDRILGAHILGPQAATLIHILSVAMQFDIPATQLAARPFWTHPTLPELIENTLLELD